MATSFNFKQFMLIILITSLWINKIVWDGFVRRFFLDSVDVFEWVY